MYYVKKNGLNKSTILVFLLLCFCWIPIFAMFLCFYVRHSIYTLISSFRVCYRGIGNLISEIQLFFILIFVFIKRWGYASALKSLVLLLCFIRITIDS